MSRAAILFGLLLVAGGLGYAAARQGLLHLAGGVFGGTPYRSAERMRFSFEKLQQGVA